MRTDSQGWARTLRRFNRSCLWASLVVPDSSRTEQVDALYMMLFVTSLSLPPPILTWTMFWKTDGETNTDNWKREQCVTPFNCMYLEYHENPCLFENNNNNKNNITHNKTQGKKSEIVSRFCLHFQWTKYHLRLKTKHYISICLSGWLAHPRTHALSHTHTNCETFCGIVDINKKSYLLFREQL